MEPADIEFALECTQNEGWAGETREDFESFMLHDNRGCFVAQENNRRIGICVATAYQENGFIGELIVINEMRGKGYGKKLFDHSVNYLISKGLNNIYLDGDLDAVPIYEKSGFRKICKSLRFTGKPKAKFHPYVKTANNSDIEKICEIDKMCFGDDRSFFLKRKYKLYPEFCLVIKHDNAIMGYIMAKPGVNVLSVGPFTNNDPVPVSVLLESLATRARNQIFRIGILEHSGYIDAVRTLPEFTEQTPCWRMVYGKSDRLGIGPGLVAIGSAASG